MQKRILAMAVASLFPAFSQAASSSEKSDETIVVTANGFEQSLDETVASVEVVTKADIEAMHAASVLDVLKYLPSVQIKTNGGFGQSSEVYVRGRSTKNVLVLINGVRIGSASKGATNFSALPLDGIERIEFLRGPRAAVYGSDAVTGVINIITTAPGKSNATVSTMLGSNNYAGLSAGFGLGDTDGWLNITASHQQSDGFDAIPTNTSGNGADDDGFRTQYALIDSGKAFNDNYTLKLNGYYQYQYNDYDGFRDQSKSDLYEVAAVNSFHFDNVSSDLTIAVNQDKNVTFSDSQSDSVYKTQRVVTDWKNIAALNENLNFLGGLQWYQDKVTSTTYTSSSRTNSAAYVGANIIYEALTTDVNVRLDNDNVYGNFPTYQLASRYAISNEYAVSFSLGKSFKAPTFNQLYYTYTGYLGNLDLQPEETVSGEVSFNADFESISYVLTYYAQDVTNLINTDGTQYQNIDKAKIKGVEASVLLESGPFSQRLSYDYLDAVDQETGYFLDRRAKHSVKWQGNLSLNKWLINLSYLYQGKRYDDAKETDVLAPYSLADLSVTYFFTNGLELGGKISNLTNTDYETAKDYNTADREYYLTAKYNF